MVSNSYFFQKMVSLALAALMLLMPATASLADGVSDAMADWSALTMA